MSLYFYMALYKDVLIFKDITDHEVHEEKSSCLRGKCFKLMSMWLVPSWGLALPGVFLFPALYRNSEA